MKPDDQFVERRRMLERARYRRLHRIRDGEATPIDSRNPVKQKQAAARLLTKASQLAAAKLSGLGYFGPLKPKGI